MISNGINDMHLWAAFTVGIMSISGNLLIMVFLCTRKNEQNNGTVQVKLSMILSDLMTAAILITCFLLPTSVNALKNEPIYLISVPLYHLSLLGIMGFQAIKNPIAQRNFIKTSKCKMSLFCVLVWFLPVLLLNICLIFGRKFDAVIGSQFTILTSMATLFTIPYFVTITSTLKMYQAYHEDKLRQQEDESNDDNVEMNTLIRNANGNLAVINNSSKLQGQERDIHRKIIEMIVLIFLGYSMSCIPFFIHVILISLYPKGYVLNLAFNVINPVLFCKTIITIIVLMRLDTHFRQFMAGIFLCLSCFLKRF